MNSPKFLCTAQSRYLIFFKVNLPCVSVDPALSRSVASCQAIENNNDLLEKKKQYVSSYIPNETYAYIVYTRMCVYTYAHVRIWIRVYAYWADAHYAYILVRTYLSCTVCS